MARVFGYQPPAANLVIGGCHGNGIAHGNRDQRASGGQGAPTKRKRQPANLLRNIHKQVTKILPHVHINSSAYILVFGEKEVKKHLPILLKKPIKR